MGSLKGSPSSNSRTFYESSNIDEGQLSFCELFRDQIFLMVALESHNLQETLY